MVEKKSGTKNLVPFARSLRENPKYYIGIFILTSFIVLALVTFEDKHYLANDSLDDDNQNYYGEESIYDEESLSDKFDLEANVDLYEGSYGQGIFFWDHMPITYNYNEECAEWNNGAYPQRIEQALQEITEVTDGLIEFQRVYSTKADITYICDKSQYYSSGKTIAEAEPWFWEGYDETGGIYAESFVYIYDPNGCRDRPTTLIHETLHLLGIEHPPKTEENLLNIMFEKNYSCDAIIYPETIEYLKFIYSS